MGSHCERTTGMDSEMGKKRSQWPLSGPKRQRNAVAAACLLLANALPTATAQSCIPLTDSRECSAFNASSISTSSALVGLFPFLSSVTNVATFDSGLQNYISNGFTQLRYQNLLGCSNVNLANTTGFYARYTASVICNAIVQNSITPCSLSGNATRPLCVNSCAQYARSEEEIAASSVCASSGADLLTQVRADFTNCALPANSLSGACIEAVTNEPNNCGFASNTGSFCRYCAASSPNATDSCCVYSKATTLCRGVVLPVVASSALAPVTTTASSPAESSTSGVPVAAAVNRGLTGGQIAGIAVGAILGALLLLALIIVGCLCLRRRQHSSPPTSVFNQPATMREVEPSTSYTEASRDHERAGLAVPFGARVARMSALEGSSSSNDRNGTMGGYRKSTSSEEETPASRGTGLAPPTTAKRSGSLSSGSRLATMTGFDTSPSSNNEAYTSPESQGQSEQLGFFKDYYSQDEIHSGDVVSTLWAYEPRAADEFHLERGDMIKVLGIWDDGWATGVRVRQRADDWRPDEKLQRDSGMSNGSSQPPPTTAESEGEVKAFPLVCVCLPQHWRKTIEGDSTEGSGGY